VTIHAAIDTLQRRFAKLDSDKKKYLIRSEIKIKTIYVPKATWIAGLNMMNDNLPFQTMFSYDCCVLSAFITAA
jgi:hypothetical protein